jgi:hypothetical protein
VVHPATSITMHSALTTIKKIFCINPAKWKRAIKVLLLFEMERKFARYLGECDGSGEIPDKKSGHERGLHQSCLRLPRVWYALIWYNISPQHRMTAGTKRRTLRARSHASVHTRAAGLYFVLYGAYERGRGRIKIQFYGEIWRETVIGRGKVSTASARSAIPSGSCNALEIFWTGVSSGKGITRSF